MATDIVRLILISCAVELCCEQRCDKVWATSYSADIAMQGARLIFVRTGTLVTQDEIHCKKMRRSVPPWSIHLVAENVEHHHIYTFDTTLLQIFAHSSFEATINTKRIQKIPHSDCLSAPYLFINTV